MPSIITHLNLSEENLYKCYFGKSFFSTIKISHYKQSIILSIIFFILFLISLVFSKSVGDYWLSTIVFLFPTAITIFNLIEYLWRCFKWKQSVDAYVKEFLAFKKVILTINENGCGLETDTENNFQYWNSISNYTITNNFIKITASDGTSILVPATSTDVETRTQIIDLLSNRKNLTKLNSEEK